MSQINFTKMQGAGNDFILIDNRKKLVTDNDKPGFARTHCPRAVAVGADGVIFLEDDPEYDFQWSFWNADGSEAEMCGNGARCMTVFAHRIGAAAEKMSFRTIAGIINGTIVPGGARVNMTDAGIPESVPGLDVDGRKMEVFFINTGVPHAVIPVNDIEAVNIKRQGSAIRYHERFAPAGTNVNFMCRDNDNQVVMRTYERGVEDETLACGTGAVACAIVATSCYSMRSPIRVRTRSNSILTIDFEQNNDRIVNILLEGPAKCVYEGRLCL